MSVSFCLHILNERQNLPRCLASIRPVADEIVVADTGSTDGSQEIARSFGAKVFGVKWCDDFSRARNAAMERAGSDWIFIVDADEELLTSSQQRLRKETARADVAGFYVLRQDVYRLDLPNHFTEGYQLRLLRNRPDLRFTGRAHPDIVPALKDAALSRIQLRHYGYLPELRASKAKRALGLLELQHREEPGNLYIAIELGRTLVDAGEQRGHEVLAKAVDVVLQKANEPEPPSTMAAALLEYVLSADPALYRGRLTPLEALHLALRWFPTNVPLLCRCAQQALQTQNIQFGSDLLERAISLFDAKRYDRSMSFDPAVISPWTRLRLAECYVRTKQQDKAAALLAQLAADEQVGAKAAELSRKLSAPKADK